MAAEVNRMALPEFTRPALLAALLAFAAPMTHAMDIIAHRGASYDAPENTLASFRLGWEKAPGGNELDIHLTRDGKIVVMHDDNTKRTTGVSGKIREQTLEQIRALDAGIWKGSQWKGEKVPTLEEVLSGIPRGKKLFIEIKCGPEVIPELRRVIEASGKGPDQLAVIAFNIETLEQSRKSLPSLPHYWLARNRPLPKSLTRPGAQELIAAAKARGLNGLDLEGSFPIDADFVRTVHDAGLKLFVWTVDDPVLAKKLVAAGVDGIRVRDAWRSSPSTALASVSPESWRSTR
jgi:glycerophosphoryl diester phosphodiesterase